MARATTCVMLFGVHPSSGSVTDQPNRAGAPRWRAMLWLLPLLVALVLATLGTLVAGMGIMTECTTNYSDTPGSPCNPPRGWLMAGTLGQVAILGLSLWALVRTARGRANSVLVPLLVAVFAVAWFGATTWAADSSYCRPGDTRPNYCDV